MAMGDKKTGRPWKRILLAMGLVVVSLVVAGVLCRDMLFRRKSPDVTHARRCETRKQLVARMPWLDDMSRDERRAFMASDQHRRLRRARLRPDHRAEAIEMLTDRTFVAISRETVERLASPYDLAYLDSDGGNSYYLVRAFERDGTRMLLDAKAGVIHGVIDVHFSSDTLDRWPAIVGLEDSQELTAVRSWILSLDPDEVACEH